MSRAGQVSVLNDVVGEQGLRPLLRNLARYAAMFHVHGDPNPRHHVPGAPLLDPVTGVAMAWGVMLAASRLADARMRFLLVWLAAGLAAGVLSSSADAPNAYRSGPVAPVACLLAGLGLADVSRRMRRFARPALACMLAPSLLALALGVNVWRCFVQYPSPALASEMWGSAETALARHVHERSEAGAGQVFVDEVYRSVIFTNQWIAFQVVCGGAIAPVSPAGVPPDAASVEVFMPLFCRARLEESFPDGVFRHVIGPGGEVLGYSLTIRAPGLSRTIPPYRPFRAVYVQPEGPAVSRVLDRAQDAWPAPDGTRQVMVFARVSFADDLGLAVRVTGSAESFAEFLPGPRIEVAEGVKGILVGKGARLIRLVSGPGPERPPELEWSIDGTRFEKPPPAIFTPPSPEAIGEWLDRLVGSGSAD